MSITDDLLANNRAFAEQFEGPGTVGRAAKIAILTCMDARLDPMRMLGLEAGTAHIVRNAGGVVTDEVIRSFAVSQHFGGTRAIMVIHHTDCALSTFTDEELTSTIVRESGEHPHFALEAFTNAADSVRRSIARLEASPFVTHTDDIRGFVYDVNTGVVDEVH